MHAIRAGCCSLLISILLTTLVLGQAAKQGEVESIGFQNQYRPDAWTPMLVRINTAGLETKYYKIQVLQEDIDRDVAAYTWPISVDTSQSTQRFWMYFRPRPTDHGLPDRSSVAELQRALKVRLCTADAMPKPIAELPITSSVQSVDPPDSKRGQKLILAVGDVNALPRFGEYADLAGIVEDVNAVMLQPGDLPENPIAYEGVDAILWLNADASRLDAGGARRLEALQSWVQTGGKLVVCQPVQRERIAALGPMLPVKTIDPASPGEWQLDIRPRDDPNPLRKLAHETWAAAKTNSSSYDSWNLLQSPFSIARANLRPGAIADADTMIDWPGPATAAATAPAADRSPFIARWLYGQGMVTWVAQDLGDPAITARTTGWPHVWDRVFGWNNASFVGSDGQEAADAGYGEGQPEDLGGSLLSAMEHKARGAQLVTLAVLFFIVYWIVAGPGSYLLLANRGRRAASWPIFAAAAIVATLVTALLVQLVLRGPPDARYLTLVRSIGNGPVVARSRIGLYIPQDGYKAVGLSEADPNFVSDVTGFAQNPNLPGGDAESPAAQDYTVPVPDPQGTFQPVSFPYRSTNKRIQCRWVGTPSSGASTLIQGSARAGGAGIKFLGGVLTNSTGVNLVDIYFAYAIPGQDPWLLYLPAWKSGAAIDLAKTFKTISPLDSAGSVAQLNKNIVVEDQIRHGSAQGTGWEELWYHELSHAENALFDDSGDGAYRCSFPMLSLFDLLPPDRSTANAKRAAVAPLRRGGREFDASGVVLAGQLLVLARADDSNTLPFTLQVDGKDVKRMGGVTFYQCAVPLKRSDDR